MTVHTLLITDASGSMQSLADDVRGGHNEYLDSLIAATTTTDEDVRITLTVFNTKVTVIDKAVPVTQATRLSHKNYRPDGFTALLDAVGVTLRQFQESVHLATGDKVFVFIQTDGQENASHEFSKAGVAKMIAELEAQSWAFTFSGTGPDDWSAQGSSMGFSASTSNTKSGLGTRSAYSGRATATVSYLAAKPEDRESFDSYAVASAVQATIDDEEGK